MLSGMFFVMLQGKTSWTTPANTITPKEINVLVPAIKEKAAFKVPNAARVKKATCTMGAQGMAVVFEMADKEAAVRKDFFILQLAIGAPDKRKYIVAQVDGGKVHPKLPTLVPGRFLIISNTMKIESMGSVKVDGAKISFTVPTAYSKGLVPMAACSHWQPKIDDKGIASSTLFFLSPIDALNFGVKGGSILSMDMLNRVTTAAPTKPAPKAPVKPGTKPPVKPPVKKKPPVLA